MQEQFGGEDENPPATGFNTFKFTKYSNAYMLVYIRKSDWGQARPPWPQGMDNVKFSLTYPAGLNPAVNGPLSQSAAPVLPA